MGDAPTQRLQAQLLEYAVASASDQPHAPSLSLESLLAAALRQARRCGAHVFNALALAEMTPALLHSLGFARGDGDTFVYFHDDDKASTYSPQDATGSGDCAHTKPISPEDVAWLPT